MDVQIASATYILYIWNKPAEGFNRLEVPFWGGRAIEQKDSGEIVILDSVDVFLKKHSSNMYERVGQGWVWDTQIVPNELHDEGSQPSEISQFPRLVILDDLLLIARLDHSHPTFIQARIKIS